MLQRRDLMRAVGAAALAGYAPARAWAAGGAPLTTIKPAWVVSEQEALDWHKFKDSKGPALTGNESWRSFLGFLETKLKEYGCVDIQRSPWTFNRLVTSVWPDDSKWGLVSNGRRVSVANFGANCGTTGPQGVSAELVLWDPNTKPDIKGKIVVYRPVPRPDVRDAFADSDYELRTPFDSWPVEGKPVPQAQTGVPSISNVVWDEMTATSSFIQQVRDLKPAGVVFAMNLNRLRLPVRLRRPPERRCRRRRCAGGADSHYPGRGRPRPFRSLRVDRLPAGPRLRNAEGRADPTSDPYRRALDQPGRWRPGAPRRGQVHKPRPPKGSSALADDRTRLPPLHARGGAGLGRPGLLHQEP
jgi:hypothetical protein